MLLIILFFVTILLKILDYALFSSNLVYKNLSMPLHKLCATVDLEKNFLLFFPLGLFAKTCSSNSVWYLGILR